SNRPTKLRRSCRNRQGSRLHPRAAKDDNGRADCPGAKPFLCLFVFELQAYSAHGVAEKEVLVQCRQAVGGGTLLRSVVDHDRIPRFLGADARSRRSSRVARPTTDTGQPRCISTVPVLTAGGLNQHRELDAIALIRLFTHGARPATASSSPVASRY